MSTDQSNNITTEPINNYTPSMESMGFFHDFIMNRNSLSLQRTNIENTNIENTGNDLSNNLSNNITYNSANVYLRFLEDLFQLPPITGNNLRTLLRDTLNESNPVKLVLSKDGEQEVSAIEFDPETHSDFNCCSITLKEFKKGDMVSKLPCNHLFNTEAIFKWLKEEKAECPICRFKLSSVEKKNKSGTNTGTTAGTHTGTTAGTHTGTTAGTHTGINTFINGFGPPRMPRGRSVHLRRLMEQRQQREEESELQAALLASLSDQYMNAECID